jgi:hypothetical protein
MEYSTPELVLLGSAAALVRGDKPGELDNDTSDTSRPPMGLALDLDD